MELYPPCVFAGSTLSSLESGPCQSADKKGPHELKGTILGTCHLVSGEGDESVGEDSIVGQPDPGHRLVLHIVHLQNVNRCKLA